MKPIQIDQQQVITNLTNKLAVAHLQVAQLEVAVEQLQATLEEKTSAQHNGEQE